MKVVAVCDSFKGSLGSADAGEAVARGIRKALQGAEVIVLQAGDGGEGTSEAIAAIVGARRVDVIVPGPMMSPVEASYFISVDNSHAYMDFAAASGITLLPGGRKDPMLATSYGVGILMSHALDAGVGKITVSLGGSATNDAGAGLLQALGCRFLTREGFILPSPLLPCNFGMVGSMDSSDALERLGEACIEALCDVDVPLCGIRGASAVFGPQKGASDDMVYLLDDALSHMADIYGFSRKQEAGGAAGGAAAAFMDVLGAEMRSGADAMLDYAGFDTLIDGASLIVTGEGSADRQTLLGKLPSRILMRGKRKDIPVALLCGKVSDKESLLEEGFSSVTDINAAFRHDSADPLDPRVAASRLEGAAFRLLSR